MSGMLQRVLGARVTVSRWAAVAALTWVVASVAFVVHARVHGDYQVDDAGITFAYARNLAAGHGAVTNPGDPTPNEGYSNPAWTYLLAAVMRAGAFDLVDTPKWLSIAFSIAALGLALVLLRQLGASRTAATLLVPAVLVANGSFVLWSVAGLENPQYVACLLLALVVYLRDRSDTSRLPWCGPLFFVVAISRPEGAVYTVAAGVDALWVAWRQRSWRWLAALIAGVGAPYVAYAVVHVAYFGDMLPNTYYAKERATPLYLRVLAPSSGGWRYLLEGLHTWAQAPLVGLAVLAVLDRRVWSRGGAALFAALGGSVLFVLQSNGDWMMQYRFMSTLYALLAVAAALGLDALLRHVSPRLWPAGGVAAVGITALVAAPLRTQLDEMHVHPTAPLADRLARHPKVLAVADGLGLGHVRALVSDMGGPMWVNADGRTTMIDMFGLCTREVALALKARDTEALWDVGFADPLPDFIQVPPTLHRTWALAASDVFRERYTHLDAWRRSDEEGGSFFRRDLVEAPWEDRWATGQVVVQGGVRVHEVTLVSSSPGRARVSLVVSLLRDAATVPRVRLTVSGAADAPVTVPLFPFLAPAALRPGVPLRTTMDVEVPSVVGAVTGVAASGASSPSDLRPPTAWTHASLGRPDDGAGWQVVGGTGVGAGDAWRWTASAEDRARVCSPPIDVGGDLRLSLDLGVAIQDGRVDLDVRGFDAAGDFVSRVRLWSFEASRARRPLVLRMAPPAGAASVRVCVVPVDGEAAVEVGEVAVERRGG